MEPVYVDVHIHTSENPDSLNQNYDIDTLSILIWLSLPVWPLFRRS